MNPSIVMAGLVPAIHADPLLLSFKEGLRRNPMDGRVKPGHDAERSSLT